jgi:phosphoenolpyruvate---glycerone phosphotransferase subunit DhaM
MIAIVLVAHSTELADGLAAMLAQSAPSVPVAVAAGTEAGVLGTSMPAARRALGAALAAADGAVVLLDLNSAVLAVEMALEALPVSMRARVRVSRGPFVEGAVMAAIAAAGGGSLDAVRVASEASPIAGKLPDDWPEDGRAPTAIL